MKGPKCRTRKPRCVERASAAKRGYDRKWEAFRMQYLTQYPLCADCLKGGAITWAKEVHHIRKVSDAPHLRLDPLNVMSLCKRCHSRRSARGE